MEQVGAGPEGKLQGVIAPQVGEDQALEQWFETRAPPANPAGGRVASVTRWSERA
jgi:hypothetical protein